VVTSRIAAGGVDAEPGAHLLVADSPSEQAAAIITVLESPNERQRLARAGRERMLSHHSWTKSMARLDGIVERCVSKFNRQVQAA
jgi:hypothetical protein